MTRKSFISLTLYNKVVYKQLANKIAENMMKKMNSAYRACINLDEMYIH